MPGEVPTVLLVFPARRDLDYLRKMIAEFPWRTLEARSCREAALRLFQYNVPVIVTERCLPDGDWKDLMSLIAPLASPPPLIVSAPRADDQLWAEVLNLGGFDVLARPFEKTEVQRVLHSAWTHRTSSMFGETHLTGGIHYASRTPSDSRLPDWFDSGAGRRPRPPRSARVARKSSAR